MHEFNPLPDLMNSFPNKLNGVQVINDYQLDPTPLPNCVNINNKDHQLDINTLLDCVTNPGKLQTAHSVTKKTPAGDHALSDRVITCGKQTVARSGEINNSVNNQTMINRSRSLITTFQLTPVKPLQLTITFTL